MRWVFWIVAAIIVVYVAAWAHGDDPVFNYVIGFIWGFALCGLIVWMNRRELSALNRPATEDRPADTDPWSVAQQVRRARQGFLAPPSR
jgi:RsiW-degrading membrane proteinase PrsW (M82 family)